MSWKPSSEVLSIVNSMQASPAEAAAKLLVLADKSPDQPEIRVLHAIALRLQGKLQDSVQTLSQMIERFPELALAHREQGINLFAKGQLPEAIRALEEAIRLQPQDPGGGPHAPKNGIGHIPPSPRPPAFP